MHAIKVGTLPCSITARHHFGLNQPGEAFLLSHCFQHVVHKLRAINKIIVGPVNSLNIIITYKNGYQNN